MGHWWVLEAKLGLHLAVLKAVNAKMVQIWEFLMSKFALYFEKIMYKDFNITFKVLFYSILFYAPIMLHSGQQYHFIIKNDI